MGSKLEDFSKMVRSSRTLYICGENLEFVWPDEQIESVIDLYREGQDILTISDYTRRHEFDVTILLLDLLRERRILMRPEGLLIPKRQKEPKLDRPKREKGQICT